MAEPMIPYLTADFCNKLFSKHWESRKNAIIVKFLFL